MGRKFGVSIGNYNNVFVFDEADGFPIKIKPLDNGVNPFASKSLIADALGRFFADSTVYPPSTADYLVKSANAGLSAERVVTDTASIAWDWATAGQAKANVQGLVIGTNVQAYSAKLAAIDTLTWAANKLMRLTGTGSLDTIDFIGGTWTPTVSTTVNVDSTTPFAGYYIRLQSWAVGIVNVDVDHTAAANTTTKIELSPPVASNFGASGDAGGAGTVVGTPNMPVEVLAVAANDTILATWKSSTTGTARLRIIFFQRII
jgi:hypothetical protein